MTILLSELRQNPSFLFYFGAFVQRRSCLKSPPRQLIIMRKCLAILPDAVA